MHTPAYATTYASKNTLWAWICRDMPSAQKANLPIIPVMPGYALLCHISTSTSDYSMNTPKSQAGNRIIPMTEKVKEAFLMEKRLQEDAGITCDISIDGYTDFVFLNRFGKVQTMSMLNKALKRIMRDCNDQILSNAEEDEDVVLLPPFSCHVLRHTFATRLCESGMNIKVIQSVLGHADLSTTINTYIHATEDFKKEEFSKQSRYLSIGAADLESETILS